MTHRHFIEDRPHVEVGPTVCLQPSRDEDGPGVWVNFEPPPCAVAGHVHERDGLRQMGRVSLGGGAWTATGSLEAGDMTIHPSIRIADPEHGELLHGWVRAGKWIPTR